MTLQEIKQIIKLQKKAYKLLNQVQANGLIQQCDATNIVGELSSPVLSIETAKEIVEKLQKI